MNSGESDTNKPVRRHASVRDYLDDKQWSLVSRSLLTRSAEIRQSFALEATRLGYQVKYDKRGRFSVTIVGVPFSVAVCEIGAPGGQKRAVRPLDHRLPEWLSTRPWTFIPTGRLELVFRGELVRYEGVHFRDTRDLRVESRLAEAFTYLKTTMTDRRLSHEAHARDAELRRLHHEEQVVLARAEFFRLARRQALESQVKDWILAKELAEYLQAMTVSVSQLPLGEQRQEAQAWLDWSQEQISKIDPLGGRIAPPEIREPTRFELEALLREHFRRG